MVAGLSRELLAPGRRARAGAGAGCHGAVQGAVSVGQNARDGPMKVGGEVCALLKHQLKLAVRPGTDRRWFGRADFGVAGGAVEPGKRTGDGAGADHFEHRLGVCSGVHQCKAAALDEKQIRGLLAALDEGRVCRDRALLSGVQQ